VHILSGLTPDNFIVPRIESDEGLILPSEMAVQSSQIAVWLGYNMPGDVVFIQKVEMASCIQL
jgi:hypothetical protein